MEEHAFLESSLARSIGSLGVAPDDASPGYRYHTPATERLTLRRPIGQLDTLLVRSSIEKEARSSAFDAVDGSQAPEHAPLISTRRRDWEGGSYHFVGNRPSDRIDVLGLFGNLSQLEEYCLNKCTQFMKGCGGKGSNKFDWGNYGDAFRKCMAACMGTDTW